MFLIYKPEGFSEETRYEFRPKRLPSSEAAQFQKLYRRLSGNQRALWTEIKEIACPSGDPTAKRLMLWYCKRQIHPTIKLEDVDPIDEDIEIELDLPENKALRVQLVEARDVDEDMRAMMLEQIDRDIVLLEGDEEEGKASASMSMPSSTEPSTNTTEI